uniref:Uncharacterized protein n=1 Tax=Hyaloperonospora arabidopsidis (strain Emoy2) TaxID=559515 RepID=M4BNW5_HYAAE
MLASPLISIVTELDEPDIGRVTAARLYEWIWGGAVPDEEMNGASLHVGSPDEITPTRSETVTKTKDTVLCTALICHLQIESKSRLKNN